jgi:hypothetical protein
VIGITLQHKPLKRPKKPNCKGGRESLAQPCCRVAQLAEKTSFPALITGQKIAQMRQPVHKCINFDGAQRSKGDRVSQISRWTYSEMWSAFSSRESWLWNKQKPKPMSLKLQNTLRILRIISIHWLEKASLKNGVDVAYSNEELFLSNVELKVRRYASSSCVAALSGKQRMFAQGLNAATGVKFTIYNTLGEARFSGRKPPKIQ